MSGKLAKMLIFAAGAVVGAVISALATKEVVKKAYWDECDRELNDLNLRHKGETKALRDEIDELKQTILQQKVAIQVLSEQVSGGNSVEKEPEESENDPEDDRFSAENGPERDENEAGEALRRGYSGTDLDEDLAQEEEIEAEEAHVEQNRVHFIDEITFDTTGFEYGKEELRYYIYDGRVLNEDGEWLENYADFIGEAWREGDHKHGDTAYIRNEYYLTDYMISFVAGYGEEHISVSDTDWEG